MTPLRWRYPDVSEDDARGQVVSRIDAWWKAFQAAAPAFDAAFKGNNDLDIGGFMDEHYHAIAEGLFSEFGPGVSAPHRLVLTAESNRHLRPLVDALLKRAPKIDGFEFYGYRLSEPASLEMTVEGRTGVKASELTIAVEPVEYGQIGITLFVPSVDDKHREAAFVACETALGEEALACWVGPIDVKEGQGAPLSELKPEVDKLIAQRLASLPEAPVCKRIAEANWSLIEVQQPEEPTEVAQGDLFLGKCIDVDFFNNTRCGLPFDSKRFSRAGETFVYLKIDGSEGLPQGGFDDKAAIEDAIDGALVSKGLGCVIGGGTGRRYSYIDLALTNVDEAVSALREVLQKGLLPKRSWIHFFDSDLQWEWIPVWPDAPVPPLPPVEA